MRSLTSTIEEWLGANGYEGRKNDSGLEMWTRREWTRSSRTPDPETGAPSFYYERQHPIDVLVPLILSAEKHGHPV